MTFIKRLALSLLFFVFLFAGLTFLSRGLTVYAATEPADPEQIPVKVLLVIYDPVLESYGGVKLHQYYAPQGWNDPVTLANTIANDLNTQSHGKVNYQIVQTIDRDEWPIYLDGTRYDDASYIADYNSWDDHASSWGNYNAIITDNGIIAKINNGEIDEVWMYGAPGFRWWEHTTAGNGAYSTNGGPVTGVNTRLFSILGLNYQRPVGQALESYGHGVEGVMRRMFGSWNPEVVPDLHSWNAFTVLEAHPGNLIGCGNAHGHMNTPATDPPSNTDWTDLNNVASTCDDWSNYPFLTGATTDMNCSAWGCNLYDGIRWWYNHMPYMAGTYDGYLANWWRYFANLATYRDAGQVATFRINSDLAENYTAWSCAAASGGTCSLANDSNRIFNNYSVKMDTDASFDAYMKYPSAANANWDLTTTGILSFFAYTTNTNTPQFQNSIIVYLKDSSGNGYKYQSVDSQFLNNSILGWKRYDISLGGDPFWTRTSLGTPNLADIDYVEVHADTWGSGFTLALDGLGFVADLSETPTGWTCNGGACTVSQASGLSKEGINGVKLSTDSSGDTTLTKAFSSIIGDNKNLVFWAYSDNPNPGKFEANSFYVDIGTSSEGFYRYTPSTNLLNSAIGRWQRYEIPFAGNSVWVRSSSGSPNHLALNSVTFHNDTTGTTPYFVIYDGFRFEEKDYSPPSVSITSPSGGTTVTGTVTLAVNAYEYPWYYQSTGVPTVIKRVDLLVDGVYVQTDAIAPYVFFYDTSNLTSGNHNFTAKAYDMAENTNSTTTSLNTQPDFINFDGFESNTFAEWYGQTDTEDDLTITNVAAQQGSFGLSALIDNTTSMFITDRANYDPHYRARFYFDPNSVSIPDGQNLSIFYGELYSSAPRFDLQLSNSGGYRIRTRAYSNGAWVDGSWVSLSDAPHHIEIEWQATATGASNGYLSLWADGVTQGIQSGLNNGNILEAYLGAYTVPSGTSGTVYFDSFESRRGSYIGAYSDVIFSDSFETGNFDAWTSKYESWTNKYDTENDLTITDTAALSGSLGLSALIDNTTSMYAGYKNKTAEPSYHSRFDFDPNSITMADGDIFTILTGRSGGSTAFEIQFSYSSSTGYNIRPAFGTKYGTWIPVSDAPHSIEIDWRVGTNLPSGNNGYFTLWADDIAQSTLTGLYNSSKSIDEVFFGVTYPDAGTSGTIYLDNYESRKTTAIGQLSDIIFANGLETGNPLVWTSETDAENDLTVTSAATIQGSWGLSALIDNTTDMYLTDTAPNSEVRYRSRFYLDPNSTTMASGDTFSILLGRTTTSTFQVQLYYSGGYQIRTQIYTDAGVETNGSWVSISDGPHPIEIDWMAATAAGANDGYITLWIDGVASSTQSGIDNDTKRVDEVRLGAVNGVDAGTSGTVFLDTFESRDNTYIGPYSPSDTIFTDGFESGGAPVWSSETDAENDLSVTTGSKLHGTYGLSALVDNTTATYVTDTTPNNLSRYRSRFYFDPNSLTMTGGDRFNLFTGRTTTSSFDVILYRNSTSGYNIRTQIYNDAATEIDGTYVPISDAPHAIEIDWQAASAPGANDGSIALWVDGILQGVQGAIDNDTKRVDEVRLGAVGGVDAGTSGTFYLDTFESRNTSYIGILEPVSDTILSDGFESGNASMWSSETDTENDMSVTTGSKLDGNYGLSALIDNTTDMYVSAFTTSKNRYRARFYFDPNSITMANDDRFSLLTGRVSNSSFQVQMKYSTSTGYNIRTSIHDDALVETYGTYVPITDAPHAIEVDWEAASAVGANDGSISLWVDGVFKDSSTGIDNDTKRVEEVRLGAATGLDAGTSGTIYLDKFEARRSTYIGL